MVSLPERTRAIFNLVAEKLGEGAGVELHAGKTRVWNRAGDCPPDMEELGPEVWNAAGIKIGYGLLWPGLLWGHDLFWP